MLLYGFPGIGLQKAPGSMNNQMSTDVCWALCAALLVQPQDHRLQGAWGEEA